MRALSCLTQFGSAYKEKKLKKVRRSVDQHLVEMCSFSYACRFYIHGKRDTGHLLETAKEFDII
jgi:hypothetical protein